MTVSVRQGQTLSVTTGTWANAPTAFAYQWQRAKVDIPGAATNSYVAQAVDVGFALRCAVTATNAAGSTTAYTVETSPVTAA